MTEIKAGDVVRLSATATSAPMRMAVAQVLNGSAYCIWFDRDDQRNEYPFPVTLLQKCPAAVVVGDHDPEPVT
jgi:uncharacterized protein YodC (DUF2158 family)